MHLPQHYYQGLLPVLQVGMPRCSDNTLNGQHTSGRAIVVLLQAQQWHAKAFEGSHTHGKADRCPALFACCGRCSQACPDVASILALTSQLWQSGMLRMLCHAYASTLQQQAAAAGPLGALLGALAGGQPAGGLAQLAGLLGGGGAAAAAVGGNAPALAALLQGPGAAQSLLGALGGGGASQMGPLAAQLGPLLAAAGMPPQATGIAASMVPPLGLAVPPNQQQPLAATTAGKAAAAAPAGGQPTSPPPAKRGRVDGGKGAAGKEAAMPPQMQQLLALLSRENATGGDPALAALAEQAQRAQQAEQAAAAEVKGEQQDGAAQQAEQAEPAAAPAGVKPEAAEGQQAADLVAAASAFAAAAVAAEAEDALAAAVAAAPSEQPQQQPNGSAAPPLQRTPSGQAQPARQPSLRIVQAQPQAQPRGGAEGHGTASGRPPTSPQHAGARRGSGAAGAGGFGAPKGATVTTGMHRSSSSGAPPVTTGGSLASAGSLPSHSAFGAAVAMASQVPGRVGKSGLPRVMRSESSPAAINGGLCGGDGEVVWGSGLWLQAGQAGTTAVETRDVICRREKGLQLVQHMHKSAQNCLREHAHPALVRCAGAQVTTGIPSLARSQARPLCAAGRGECIMLACSATLAAHVCWTEPTALRSKGSSRQLLC